MLVDAGMQHGQVLWQPLPIRLTWAATNAGYFQAPAAAVCPYVGASSKLYSSLKLPPVTVVFLGLHPGAAQMKVLGAHCTAAQGWH